MAHTLAVKDAECRSAHGARVNIAWARYKNGSMSHAEFRAECDEAMRERNDRTGEFIREYLKQQ